MKFLVDAQLPKRLSDLLCSIGFDSIHTLELPDGNQTSDNELNRISTDQKRVLVTKDSDFVDSLIQRGEPYKLLIVSTGNICNRELLDLFQRNISGIADLFTASPYVELTADNVVDHDESRPPPSP
jgi:predicted nuclease of predicted toxin-antitoxin system